MSLRASKFMECRHLIGFCPYHSRRKQHFSLWTLNAERESTKWNTRKQADAVTISSQKKQARNPNLTWANSSILTSGEQKHSSRMNMVVILLQALWGRYAAGTRERLLWKRMYIVLVLCFVFLLCLVFYDLFFWSCFPALINRLNVSPCTLLSSAQK